MYPFAPWRWPDTVRLVVTMTAAGLLALVGGIVAAAACVVLAPRALWKVVEFLRGDVAEENARLLRGEDRRGDDRRGDD